MVACSPNAESHVDHSKHTYTCCQSSIWISYILYL